jgi:hypothetical protein
LRILAALLLLAAAPPARADTGEVPPLADNSFLIEEAYNQEAGVLQNIGTFTRDRDSGSWVATFTQEWPLSGEAHQLSFTLPYAGQAGPTSASGPGDLALNYRYQAVDTEDVAVSPRFSLLLPTGDSARALGAGGVGAQVAVPLSVRLSPRLVTHVNLGVGWTPAGKSPDGRGAASLSYFVGQSFVALVHPRLNLLVEVLFAGSEAVSGGATRRTQSLVVSPGVRCGFDLPGGLQIVPGLAVPLGIGPSAGSVAVLGYLSFEFPFTSTGAEPDQGEPHPAAR